MRRSHRALAVLIATPLLLLAAAAAWIHHAADRRWTRALQRLELYKAMPEDPLPPRPVFPEPLTGTPDADYLAACKGAYLNPAFEGLTSLMALRSPADEAAGHALLAEHAPLLAAVDRGARRESPPTELQAVLRISVCTKGGRADFLCLAKLAVLRSRLEAGGPARAVRPLLAQAGMMTDMMGHATLRYPALQALEIVLLETQRQVEAEGWAREELERLVPLLNLLDARVPSRPPDLADAAARTLESFLEEPPNPVNVDWLDRWRYGFSSRLMLADAADWVDRWADRALNLGNGSYAEAVALDVEAGENWERPRNPTLHLRTYLLPQAASVYERIQKARLRLLRVAARHRIDGTLSFLEDPFDSSFIVERLDDGLYVRCTQVVQNPAPLRIRLRAP